MSHPRSRRRFLAALGAVPASLLLAGCTSDRHYPEDRPGQPDLVLKNCHSEAKTVQVSVTRAESGETIHDHAHEVPADFCSDVGPSYQIEEIWTVPGEYLVHVEVAGMDPAEATVELSATAVEDDTATRYVYVDDGEIEIA